LLQRAFSLECKHCVAELYRADSEKLNDEAFVREALANAADLANATLIDIRTHPFDPQGITGFALLAESHISIHTWPECGFAAIDAFTCGDRTKPDVACSYLADAFLARGHSISIIERGSPKMLSNSNL
jgi:S-adenosylmethionine decarboxylase